VVPPSLAAVVTKLAADLYKASESIPALQAAVIDAKNLEKQLTIPRTARKPKTLNMETARGMNAAFERAARPDKPVVPANSVLGKGERIVLTAVAQHSTGATREHLTVVTGYKRSTRDAYLQRLKQAGFVDVDNGDIVATSDGIEALGSSFRPLPTGAALRAHYLATLPEGERKVLDLLITYYPQAVQREALGDETGYKRSTRDAYIQRLTTRKLVENAGSGAVKATGILFG
jgi:hypothetical protein